VGGEGDGGGAGGVLLRCEWACRGEKDDEGGGMPEQKVVDGNSCNVVGETQSDGMERFVYKRFKVLIFSTCNKCFAETRGQDDERVTCYTTAHEVVLVLP
jgi:hypothetical protein